MEVLQILIKETELNNLPQLDERSEHTNTRTLSFEYGLPMYEIFHDVKIKMLEMLNGSGSIHDFSFDKFRYLEVQND